MAADRITVIRDGHDVRVVVDGVEIPARAIRRDSLAAPVDPDEPPVITLALIARDVHITNTDTTLCEGDTPHGPAR